MTLQDCVPYVEIPTDKGETLKFLIDTGANKSYIAPRLVKKAVTCKPFTINNINGKFQVNQYVEFNPFPHSKTSGKLKFFVFDFHQFFDGLIGYESLQMLKAIIIAGRNELKLPDLSIKLCRKFPGCATLTIGPHKEKWVEMLVNKKEGDFLIENDIETAPSVFFRAGIYRARNHKTMILIANEGDKENQISLGTISTDVDNFEINMNENVANQPESNNRLELDQLIRASHLNDEERKALFKLLNRFRSVCHTSDSRLTFTNAVKHNIKTADDFPVYTKSYKYPHCHKLEVQKQINKMLEDGIIRESNSPWSAPVWVVPKKVDASGKKKWRLVVDYRKLNAKTVADRYPMPEITEILDKLGKCNYFSTLDLASGFHQVEVAPEDIQKTAFSVENGHYEFTRMPFGLKNAPATFQRVMDNVLREFIGRICFVYMDDIIVFSTSLQEHIDNLRKILSTLERFDLKLQLDKCEFLCKEVAFLGHVVTPEGVKPNPSKIEAIQKWPIPKNEKELRRFLGTVGYYRRFIRDLARIIKPMTSALEKGKTVEHTPEFIKAFEKCKSILTSSDILQYPDFSKEFIVTTDASDYAIGAVLSQGKIGEDRPIAYASRTLTSAEQNYSAIEKELLAIVWGCKYFRPYIYGRQFTLYTDHKPLTYCFGLKTTNDRLIRWRLALSEFTYTIKYREGRQNVVADGLSRAQEINFNDASSTATHGSINDPDQNLNDNESQSSGDTAHSAETDGLYFIPMTEKPVNGFANQIILLQGEIDDAQFEEVFTNIKRHTITKTMWDEHNITETLKERLDFKRCNCIYCPEPLIFLIQQAYRTHFSQNRNIKICIAQRMLDDIKTIEEQNLKIEETHLRAHRGVDENCRAISTNFFFPNMKRKVTQFINLCTTCKKAKYDRKPYKIQFAETPIPRRPLEIVHFDIFISMPNLFLSAVDKLSRFGVLIPIKSRAIADVRKAILKFVSTYGAPNLIVCDNEPSFRSIEVRGLLESLNIQWYFSPPNRSEVNGIVERFHSTIAEIFRCIKNDLTDIPQKQIFLAAVSHYNASVHSATKLKPREVFYGIKEGEERRLEIERLLEDRNRVYDEAVLELLKKQKLDLDRANASRETEPSLDQGETVFIKRQGVKSKVKDMFIQAEVQQDNRKTCELTSGKKAHKANIKRKNK